MPADTENQQVETEGSVEQRFSEGTMTTKYLEFVRMRDTGKTEVYDVMSALQGVCLGEIKWFGRWRQYSFYPTPETIWNPECLDAISAFIRDLMDKRRTR